jgi:hypothetical protein
LSADGYISDDLWFGTSMMYLFGEDALTKIETILPEDDYRHQRLVKLHLDIPSLDAIGYLEDFKAGTLAISDLKSFVRTYTWITRILRDMRRSGESVWHSPSWVAGRG